MHLIVRNEVAAATGAAEFPLADRDCVAFLMLFD